MTGKGRTFGKIKLGPFSYFFNKRNKKSNKRSKGIGEDSRKNKVLDKPQECVFFETAAIDSLRSNTELIHKIRQNGIPWRGVQERLKIEVPEDISNRDDVAYGLVPKAMNAIFGRQETGWKTEKRPSKSGDGYTTWIVIIEDGV